MFVNKYILQTRPFRTGVTAVLLVLLLLPLLLPVTAVSAQSGNVGYRDFPFPSGLGGSRGPTGEKPESKLWWTDGSWYGSLWSMSANSFTIHRFNISSQSWTDTGVKIDDRFGTKADALWDGSKLYIVSHIFMEGSSSQDNSPPAPADQRGELYRYSYSASTKTFSLDSGFPVNVNDQITETLVVDKDSAGTLWVTYVKNRRVMVNHSLNGDDRQWGTPFILPAGGMEAVQPDDISSLISYNNFIGVMWTRQTGDDTIYFSVHPVSSPDSTWTRARAYAFGGDDHINLKALQSDSAGNVFAVIKTNDTSALVVLLVCKANGNRCRNDSDWQAYTVYNSTMGEATRPILVIDESNRHLYVFTKNETTISAPDGIYYKRANLDTISFNPNDLGTPFIVLSTDPGVDDATSSKQNVTSATGLLVLASNTRTNYYLHNYMPLGGTPPAPPAISSFSPTSGPAGTQVVINGSNFNGTTSVTFNNVAAQNFLVESTSRITATVPANTTSGQIRVTNAAGTATSSGSFTVTATPSYTLNLTTQGSGQVTVSPSGGTYPQGTVVQLTAQPAEGWLFAGWQGDLTGSANPANITMNANKSVTALFTQQTGGGAVAYQSTVTGAATNAASVSTPATVSGSGLFLAAVTSQNSRTVNSVSGLGLTWTRVLRQCGARGATMVDVWAAQGAPSGSGAVTAQFNASFKSANIAVSRYTGASTTQPFGAVIGGNTRGLSGACSGGTDTNSYALNMTTTTPGSVVYVAVSMRNRGHTPGAGYTERVEARVGSGGDQSSVAVEDKIAASAGATLVNGTLSGTVDWSVVGVEILPGGGTPPPPPAAPTISGFNPTSGPVGTEVTITGTNFTGATTVTFNNTAAQSFTVDSATSIRATVASGTTSGQIRVTTPGGTAASSGSFTVTTTPPPAPTISGFNPTSGPVGTEVTITGTNFTGATAVTFNNTAAQTFTVDSATSIRAVVAAGTSSGQVRVTTPGGTAASSGSFTITTTQPTTYILSTSVQGSGQIALDPPGGTYNQGTVVQLTAQPAAGWLFSGWQGDLTGSANPAAITMDGNKTVTAVFTQQTGGGGTVTYEGTVTGTGLATNSVSTDGNVGGAGTTSLYLAAVTTRNPQPVSSISGLGLTWTRVMRQCSGRNATMVDLWMAQGTPAADGTVTAQFATAHKSAVIAVSRYTGASASQPLGAVISGTTTGLNGACSGGTDTASYSFNITTTTPGSVVYAAASMRNRLHTPGSGYTERSETFAGSSGDVASIAVEEMTTANPASTPVSGTFNGIVDWSMVAVEIRPAE